jgi:hypothetical protein
VETTRSASDDRNVQHLLVCLFQLMTGRVHYKAIRTFVHELPSGRET